MPITIKDISKETGFSIATISYVLNKKKRINEISDKTKNIINRAAERLGYQPNLLARSMRQQKSQAIGVVFAGNLKEVHDPIISEILSGIGEAVNDTPYSLFLFSDYEKITQASLEAAKGKKVDGLIYFVYHRTFDPFNTLFGPELEKHNIPYMGIQFCSYFGNCQVVRIDEEKASRLAVEHLVRSSYKGVGLVMDDHDTLNRREMEKGFRSAIADSNIGHSNVHEINLVGSLPPEQIYKNGYQLAHELVKKDALLASYYIGSDIAASGFIDALKDNGLKVPEDVAVIGYGNLPLYGRDREFLTTVDCKYCESGLQAGKQLVAMLDGTAKEIPEGILLEPELIVRKSSIKS